MKSLGTSYLIQGVTEVLCTYIPDVVRKSTVQVQPQYILSRGERLLDWSRIMTAG